MPRDIIVVGASAGGIEALRILVSALPRDLPASLFVVLHTSPESPGLLADILDRDAALSAVTPEDGELIKPGNIYVAAPDRHMVIEPRIIRMTRGPKENRFRPAIDPLFRSAAQIYGPRVIGVVMTGYQDDGTAGLKTIKQLGGAAIVQDPADALVPFMPQSALAHVEVDYCVPLAEIAPLLIRLAAEEMEAEGVFAVPKEVEIEVNIAKEQRALDAGVLTLGEPSNYACPECHGVLLQVKDGEFLRFRCHTGHGYALESLMADITEKMEDALWNAIRAFEEGELFMRTASVHVRESHNGHIAQSLIERAEETRRRSACMRDVAVSQGETAAK